jgi:hypothetical protein
MFLVMSDDDRESITEHGRDNIYQTFFPNGGVFLHQGLLFDSISAGFVPAVNISIGRALRRLSTRALSRVFYGFQHYTTTTLRTIDLV